MQNVHHHHPTSAIRTFTMRNPLKLLALCALPLLFAACGGGGGGGGGGGNSGGGSNPPPPPPPGPTVSGTDFTLDGTITPGLTPPVEVTVDGDAATLTGETWTYSGTIPDHDHSVLVSVSSNGTIVSSQEVRITQSE